MKGVVLGICPDASLVDLCHEIPPHDIVGGSFLLHMAVGAFPAGTIHVAVVDPGVGGARRPILAEIDGQVFVGPDNGVLSYPLASAGRCEVRRLSVEAFWRHPVSTSFHGRDVFAPVAGHLAAGVDPDRFGPPHCRSRPPGDPASRASIPRVGFRGGDLGGSIRELPHEHPRPSRRRTRRRSGVGRSQVWVGGRHARPVRPDLLGGRRRGGRRVRRQRRLRRAILQPGNLARDWQVRIGDPVMPGRSQRALQGRRGVTRV